jgi:head-tail adaptor
MKSRLPDYSAGEFRHLVTVRRVSETPDGSGGYTKRWVDAGQVYCKITEKRDGEPYGDASTARIRTFKSWEFVTWYGCDVRETDKLVFDGEEFNVKGVDDVNLLHKFAMIRAETGVEQ